MLCNTLTNPSRGTSCKLRLQVPSVPAALRPLLTSNVRVHESNRHRPANAGSCSRHSVLRAQRPRLGFGVLCSGGLVCHRISLVLVWRSISRRWRFNFFPRTPSMGYPGFHAWHILWAFFLVGKQSLLAKISYRFMAPKTPLIQPPLRALMNSNIAVKAAPFGRWTSRKRAALYLQR